MTAYRIVKEGKNREILFTFRNRSRATRILLTLAQECNLALKTYTTKLIKPSLVRQYGQFYYQGDVYKIVKVRTDGHGYFSEK